MKRPPGLIIKALRPACRQVRSLSPQFWLRPTPIRTIQNSAPLKLRTTPQRQNRNSAEDAAYDEDDDMGAKEGKKVQAKTPKGTRDWAGQDIDIREDIFAKIQAVFKRHGGTALDTPVFELNEILSNKYGEDSKLIYELQDQGGELCSLRYDLTVPFARYLAQTATLNIKRYHIAKVYRRDQPSVARGRMREFFQCDFDIAGEYDSMIPDSEILCLIVEVFDALKLGDNVTIKLNHRKILDGLFAVCGVPEDLIRPISSAVDKMDKLPWEEVKKEMMDKSLPEEVADRIGEYVKLSGAGELVAKLREDAALSANETVKAGLDEMETLFKYLTAFEVSDKISFDLSLARGLDYYTGLIYEVIFNPPPEAAKDESSRVGSIAAGGRYDNLVGMFGKRQIPCVGISFGVDRIFTILKARAQREKDSAIHRNTDVYVMAFGGKGFDGLLPERMSVARDLWKAGIRAEFSAKVKPKLPQQFKAAESGNIPYAIILGEDELKAGQARLKVLSQDAGEGEEKEGRLVKKVDLADEVKKLLISDE